MQVTSIAIMLCISVVRSSDWQSPLSGEADQKLNDLDEKVDNEPVYLWQESLDHWKKMGVWGKDKDVKAHFSIRTKKNGQRVNLKQDPEMGKIVKVYSEGVVDIRFQHIRFQGQEADIRYKTRQVPIEWITEVEGIKCLKPRPDPTVRAPRKKALLLVQSYKNSRPRTLPSSYKAGLMMQDFLIENLDFAKSDITIATDEHFNITMKEMHNILVEFFRDTVPGDVLVVYFGAHGGSVKCLKPGLYEGEEKYLSGTVTGRQLNRQTPTADDSGEYNIEHIVTSDVDYYGLEDALLQSVEGVKVIGFFDCCRAGRLFGNKYTLDLFNGWSCPRSSNRRTDNKRVVIGISACKRDQISIGYRFMESLLGASRFSLRARVKKDLKDYKSGKLANRLCKGIAAKFCENETYPGWIRPGKRVRMKDLKSEAAHLNDKIGVAEKKARDGSWNILFEGKGYSIKDENLEPEFLRQSIGLTGKMLRTKKLDLKVGDEVSVIQTASIFERRVRGRHMFRRERFPKGHLVWNEAGASLIRSPEVWKEHFELLPNNALDYFCFAHDDAERKSWTESARSRQDLTITCSTPLNMECLTFQDLFSMNKAMPGQDQTPEAASWPSPKAQEFTATQSGMDLFIQSGLLEKDVDDTKKHARKLKKKIAEIEEQMKEQKKRHKSCENLCKQLCATVTERRHVLSQLAKREKKLADWEKLLS